MTHTWNSLNEIDPRIARFSDLWDIDPADFETDENGNIVVYVRRELATAGDFDRDLINDCGFHETDAFTGPEYTVRDFYTGQFRIKFFVS